MNKSVFESLAGKTVLDRVLAFVSRLEEPVFLAIEGDSGSGKSSLARALQHRLGEDCAVFHADDFFLPPARKTAERLAEPGGNIDYEALEELLRALKGTGHAVYHAYDCHTGAYVRRAGRAAALTVVEGVYSARSNCLPYYSGVVWLTVERAEQSRRILERSGPALFDRYCREWLPLERAYFSRLSTGEKPLLRLDTTSLGAFGG